MLEIIIVEVGPLLDILGKGELRDQIVDSENDKPGGEADEGDRDVVPRLPGDQPETDDVEADRDREQRAEPADTILWRSSSALPKPDSASAIARPMRKPNNEKTKLNASMGAPAAA